MDPVSEILRSPLEDRGSRQTPRRWIWAAVALGAALVVVAWLWLGGDSSTVVSTSSTSSSSSSSTSPSSSTTEALDLTPEAPAVEQFGEIVCAPDLDRVVLAGGVRYLGGANVAAVEGTWLLDPTSRSWSRLGVDEELPPRFGHAVAVAGRDVVVFGGTDAMRIQRCSEGAWCFPEALGDTWALDTTTGVWSAIDASPSPSARYGSAMAFDPVSNRVILFGGGVPVASGAPSELLDDTWALDMDTRQWANLEPATAPPPRAWQRMLYDPAAGRMILIGGIGLGSESTWSYDPASNVWEELEENPLGSRWGIAATIDPESGLIYAIGGESVMERDIASGTSRDLVVSDEVWVRHEGIWQKSEPFPAPIVGSAAYDPAIQQLILYAQTQFQATLFAFLDTTTTASWQAYEPDPG
jgi:hypothetical protein